MFRLLLLPGLLLLASAVSPAQTPRPGVSSLAADDAKRQVLDLELRWVAAEHNRDESVLRRILDDKFIVTWNAGKPSGKEEFIKDLVRTAVDPTESQTLTDRIVVVEGDTAVVAGLDTEHGTRKSGAAYTAVARYTATYVRRNGAWVALAEHMVEVPQGK